MCEWRLIIHNKQELICENCGNGDPAKFVWRGHLPSGSKRYKCLKCGKWGSVEDLAESKPPNSSSNSYTNFGETAEYVVTTEKRIKTKEDIIDLIKLDTNEWEVDHYQIGTSEAYRKDRKVEWQVTGGVVEYGNVEDSGKMLVVTLYSVRVWVKRKTQEIRTRLAIEDIKKDLEKFAPKYPKIHYPKLDHGLMLEIECPDNHIGKLAWHEESGFDSDLKIQIRVVTEVLDKLLSYAKNYPIEKILFPIGNDWYNSDSKFDTTTAGTPMQEDSRWKKTYRAGRVLAVEMIDRLSAIAPVEVLMVPGNHSEQREFFLGDALVCWYHNNPNVTINNSAKNRKYFAYGKALIGFTHGSEEKVGKLATIMAAEEPELWSKSKFREWHIGHLHHKETLFHTTHEDDGVTVRMLRSLTAPDAWHYNKGLTSALRASEAFLWDKEDGLIAQYTAIGHEVN